MKIAPEPGETPLEALLRVNATGSEMFEWNEDDLEPATPQEMRDGMRNALDMAREKGWIPAADPGCQCLTCCSFRAWIENRYSQ